MREITPSIFRKGFVRISLMARVFIVAVRISEKIYFPRSPRIGRDSILVGYHDLPHSEGHAGFPVCPAARVAAMFCRHPWRGSARKMRKQ